MNYIKILTVYLCLIALSLLTHNCLAQQKTYEVVHYKDGSMILGKLLGEIYDEAYSFRKVNGITILISKDKVNYIEYGVTDLQWGIMVASNDIVRSIYNRTGVMEINAGIMMGPESSGKYEWGSLPNRTIPVLNLQFLNLRKPSSRATFVTMSGIDIYDFEDLDWSLSILFGGRIRVGKKSDDLRPYFQALAGYQLGMVTMVDLDGYESQNLISGWEYEASAGISFNLGKVYFNVQGGYSREQIWDGYEGDARVGRPFLRAGIGIY